jgi:hypothetical protein
VIDPVTVAFGAGAVNATDDVLRRDAVVMRPG